MNVHTAPCGHPGVPVIGTFVTCSKPGCDGLPRAPTPPAPGVMQWRCPECGTLDTEFFDTANAWGAIEFWHCIPHGHVFAPKGIP